MCAAVSETPTPTHTFQEKSPTPLNKQRSESSCNTEEEREEHEEEKLHTNAEVDPTPPKVLPKVLCTTHLQKKRGMHDFYILVLGNHVVANLRIASGMIYIQWLIYSKM